MPVVPAEHFKTASKNTWMADERKHIAFFRFFFPILFILHLGGITLFNHSHVVNGVVIVHSHPYSGEHNHTEKAIETIFFLSEVVSLDGLQSAGIDLPRVFMTGEMIFPVLPEIVRTVMHEVLSLRAPPVVF